MDKSTRKRRIGHVSEVSAGNRERVSSHCPPEMTDSVKAALEAEIEAFKADPANAEIAIREAQASAKGAPVKDDYQDWLELHDFREPLEANPDIVSDEDGFIYGPSKKDANTVKLLKEFRQTLTARELQVWNMVMKHQFSLLKAAGLLNMSESSLRTHLWRATKKFHKFMEDAKHAGQD